MKKFNEYVESYDNNRTGFRKAKREDDEYHNGPDPVKHTYKYKVSKDGGEQHERSVTTPLTRSSKADLEHMARKHLEKQGYKIHEEIAVCSECGEAPCICDDSHGFVQEESINELSSDLLQRYKDKARKSADELTSQGKHGKSLSRIMSHMKATGKQIDKTSAGIKKALNREESFKPMDEPRYDLSIAARQKRADDAAKAKKEKPMKESLSESKHKVSVTVSEKDHPMVSKRLEKQQKFVKVSADSKEEAVARAKKFYTKQGYYVHNAEYHSAMPMKEETDKGEYDYEGQMARTQLQTTLRNCEDLIDMIKDDDNMPEWVQSKITLAQDYITTVRDYMQSKEELGEEVVSEALDTHQMAMAHKDKASKALETSDMKSFHGYMSNHHESMGQWHESKGRHSAADREYAKAEEHHEKSLKPNNSKTVGAK